MLHRDKLDKEQSNPPLQQSYFIEQKQKDTNSAIDVSGVSVSDIQMEKSRSNVGNKKDKSRRQFRVDDDSQEEQQDEYSIQGKVTKRILGKKQDATELRDLTSNVSDEVLFKSQADRGTEKVEMGSPRFIHNESKKEKQRDFELESSKKEFDEDDQPIFDPIKVRVGQGQKPRVGNFKFKKEEIKPNEESEMVEKQSVKSYVSGSSKRQNRKGKQENFFDFSEKLEPKQKEVVLEEEGLSPEQVDLLAKCVIENNRKSTKRRKKKAKFAREITLFYTSKSYYLFHITEIILYWVIIALFPELNIMNCAQGHHWMTHLTFGMYLILTFIFDLVFCSQYGEKENLKQQLQAFNGREDVPRNKCWACLVGWEALLQLIITQFSLLQIYCVVIFITMVKIEDLRMYLIPSLFSLCVLMLFKLYAFGIILGIFFNCIKEEDKKRKYTYRALLFSEFRLQALNVDYLEYNKRKTEFIFGLFKLLFFDVVQFGTMFHYLKNTDCGLKNANTLVYIGLIMHICSAYFGFLSRFITAFYHCKRVNRYKRRINLKISNRDLQYFGFRTIKDKMTANRKVESIMVQGETYEYLALDESKTKSLARTINALPMRYKVEFFTLNRVKIENIRWAKQLFSNLQENFGTIKFFTIQQSSLCPNFVLQLNRYIADQSTLLRFTVAFNRLSDDEILMVLETCVDHQNLEVLQLVEKMDLGEDKDEQVKLNDKQQNRVAIMKSIQVRIERNESLKKLEIRYYSLSRQMIQILLKGLVRNKALQKLILTDNSLENAGGAEFQQLEETLKYNSSLTILDFSRNENLNNHLDYQERIAQGLFKSTVSQVKRVYVTSSQKDVKEMYQQFQEDCQMQYQVYMNGKLLEDVDIQELEDFQPQIKPRDDDSDEIKRQVEEEDY